VIVCSATNFEDGRKGYAFIIDALDELARLGLKPMVFLMGWANEAVRERLSHHENCVFLGYVKPEQVPVVFGAADILLSAAVDEAFGMIYVEAAAAGVQSVAIRAGGVPEAVAQGVSGELIDVPSGAALAEACRGLLQRKRAGDWIVAKLADGPWLNTQSRPSCAG
jgi:glycosyltransferase involved in cell wall biosynthesis